MDHRSLLLRAGARVRCPSIHGNGVFKASATLLLEAFDIDVRGALRNRFCLFGRPT